MLIISYLIFFYLAFAIFSRLSSMYIQAKWKSTHSIITQFQPPLNLKPAELGYIFDRRIGKNEMTATIIDLYQRRILMLVASSGSKKSNIIVSVNEQRPHTEKLTDFEAVLVAHIAYSAGGQRNLKTLTSLYSRETGTRWHYESALISEMIEQGFLKQQARNEPFADRIIKLGFSFLVVILLSSHFLKESLSLNSEFERIDKLTSVLAAIPLLIVAGVVMYAYFSILSREISLSGASPRFATHKLRKEWSNILGYREFLRVVEWPRIKADPQHEHRSLPYCIAVGLHVDIEQILHTKTDKNYKDSNAV